jgi:5-methylcytosine-specific restriction endonuclease McrA
MKRQDDRPLKMKPCAICGVMILVAGTTKWCSECRFVSVVCATCGVKFEFYRGSLSNPTFRGHYCSTRCQPRMAPIIVPICEGCGETFRPRYHKRRRFCSRACYFASIGAHERAEHERNLEANRYAKNKGAAPYEPIDRQLVFERDGWRCRLCGGRLAMKRPAPHPKSPTIDHIVPLSCGGGHTYDNVQAAHYECNSRRSHTGAAQLMMFGSHPKKGDRGIIGGQGEDPPTPPRCHTAPLSQLR